MNKNDLVCAGQATLRVAMLILFYVVSCAILGAIMLALIYLGLKWVMFVMLGLVFCVALVWLIVKLWLDAYGDFKKVEGK